MVLPVPALHRGSISIDSTIQDHVDAWFDALIARMDARLHRMKERFDSVASRLDGPLGRHAS